MSNIATVNAVVNTWQAAPKHQKITWAKDQAAQARYYSLARRHHDDLWDHLTNSGARPLPDDFLAIWGDIVV